jgi:hypothetical protein
MIIAEHLGVEVDSAWIVPEPDPEPDGTDTLDRFFKSKMWTGRTQMESIRGLSSVERCMIAVAGTIAETLWHDPEGVEDIDWHDARAMSETDWMMAGYAPGEPDSRDLEKAVYRVTKLLRNPRRWVKLCRKVRSLIVEARP